MLVEKLLDRLATFIDKMKDKCDKDAAGQLESRVKSLEDESKNSQNSTVK